MTDWLYMFYKLTVSVHVCFFFFSSRRRHTRWTGDWSSDVCSSDLRFARSPDSHAPSTVPHFVSCSASPASQTLLLSGSCKTLRASPCPGLAPDIEIGRASCRERV